MPNFTGFFHRLNSNRRLKKENLLESKSVPNCLMSSSFNSSTISPCCGTRKPSKTASLNTNSVKSVAEKLTASSLNSLNCVNNPNAMSTNFNGFSFFSQNRSKFSKHSKNSTKKINVGDSALKISLPESILLKCVDLLENPFEICNLRALNLAVREHCETRLKQIIEMNVRKCNFDGIERVNVDLKYWIDEDPRPWFRHPAGYKILMRFIAVENNKTPSCLEILVDECWSSKDVARLCRILNVFRKPLKRIQLDAQIIELVFFYHNYKYFFR